MHPTAESTDVEAKNAFVQSATINLASARSVLLVAAQTGDPSNLVGAVRAIVRIQFDAAALGLDELTTLCGKCEVKLKSLSSLDHCPSTASFEALDIISNIEAALWNVPVRSQEFDVTQFVDASFDGIAPADNGSGTPDGPIEEFEIDEETLDIFRSEAADLLERIERALEGLTQDRSDQNAIWDLRRHVHTLKGAAGIIGLRHASETAHQMEDVLSTLAEKAIPASPPAFEFLKTSVEQLDAIVRAEYSPNDLKGLYDQYTKVQKWLASPLATAASAATETLPAATEQLPSKRTTTPIVRVSLERLDEIISVSKVLSKNWSAAAASFTAGPVDGGPDLADLFARQLALTEDLQAKLLQIRMVRFGTLKTRISRAVHGTCVDQHKKAVVEIENGEVEVDTLVIDGVIEPLLHLVKNAVVHGIEPPDIRRLIGKDETGTIRIRIEADAQNLTLSVSDDGAGISIGRIKEKAIDAGLIDEATAASMDDPTATNLIFDRGLTTAAKIDLNAGRGVGMSIVKECVEARGGTVLVESAAQRGSTFTINMPLATPFADPDAKEVEAADQEKSPLIMVVDDSASMRHITSKMVQGVGYRVTSACDGAEAVDMLLTGQCQPDLILSDVEMSQIDGWELLRFVKTNVDLGNIPVVLVTSLDADHHRRKASELGAFDYVVKPFKVEHLQAILRNLPGLALN